MATTQVVNRQIADQAIDNSKISSSAAIASSKLADGANFLKKDGSVVLTGNLDANSNKVTNLDTPTSGGDATNKTYVDGQISNLSSVFTSKGTVRLGTTANITLSGAQTIDGVSAIAGDRILVRAQTAPAENGLYLVASGAWTRTVDMDAWAEVPGAWVTVQEGSTLADHVFLSTANQGGTLNTTSITWSDQTAIAGYSNSNFVDKEVPSGSINGSNTAFTLANTPTAGSEHLYLNGLLQESGGGNDYSISGTSIVMSVAPLTGEKLRVSYRK